MHDVRRFVTRGVIPHDYLQILISLADHRRQSFPQIMRAPVGWHYYADQRRIHEGQEANINRALLKDLRPSLFDAFSTAGGTNLRFKSCSVPWELHSKLI